LYRAWVTIRIAWEIELIAKYKHYNANNRHFVKFYFENKDLDREIDMSRRSGRAWGVVEGGEEFHPRKTAPILVRRIMQPPLPPMLGEILLSRPEITVMGWDDAAAGKGQKESGDIGVCGDLA
jgi:hypothetical protein